MHVCVRAPSFTQIHTYEAKVQNHGDGYLHVYDIRPQLILEVALYQADEGLWGEGEGQGLERL